MFAVYSGLFIYPGFLFAYSIRYNNFEIFSNQLIDDNMYKILDEAENNLSDSEIYDKEFKQ